MTTSEFKTTHIKGSSFGVMERITTALENLSENSSPFIQALAARFGIGKAKTPTPAPDAKQAPPRPAAVAPASSAKEPAPATPAASSTAPADLTPAERAEWEEMESYLSSLATEEERDAYITGLVASITATIESSAPVKAKARPTVFNSAWMKLSPQGQYDFVMKQKGEILPDPPKAPTRQQDLPKNTLTRANFDKLGWRGQNEHIRNGGRVVD